MYLPVCLKKKKCENFPSRDNEISLREEILAYPERNNQKEESVVDPFLYLRALHRVQDAKPKIEIPLFLSIEPMKSPL